MEQMIDYPIAPVDFRAVSLEDAFWKPRLETNRAVTIPSVFRKCEQFGRIDNFRRAAGLLDGPYVGKMPFEDTDVYKGIEGASYSLAQHPDPAMESYLDGLISLIARAQEPDGYLYTNRTIDPAHVLSFAGSARWSNLLMSHELYNCGHLYEAACAHATATGKKSLLDIALKSAALIRSVFGPEGRHDMCGHQIVEMGLARLYRITRDRGFLQQARFFLEQRGRHEGRTLYAWDGNAAYAQDHLPVLEQREAVGHAVRAVYMYCGMADIAALWPDEAYAAAIKAIWNDMVSAKIYLTGGIGARHTGEAFGEAFELPNRTAYAESCAAIGSVMWNHRLFLLTGESKYIDVLEQTLYNRILSGVSLDGDEFFYTNPLESDGVFRFNHGSAGRQPWFEVSCCPTSLCRFFPSLPGYLYASCGNTIYVNLFVKGNAVVNAGGARFHVSQDTAYPWDGRIRITLSPETATRARLMVRVPGWAQERILGANLYCFQEPCAQAPVLALNGRPLPVELENGYAVIDRVWRDGDAVELTLPMPVRIVRCDPRVEENQGRGALQRGPLVYCVEGRDADRPLESIRLGDKSSLSAEPAQRLLGGLTVIKGPGFSAIPYYAWANRGPGPMRVWLST